MAAFYLVCIRVIYDSYENTKVFGRSCPCYSNFVPKGTDAHNATIDDVLETFARRARVERKRAHFATDAADETVYESYSEVSAVAELLFSTHFGLKCLDNSNCAAAIFYLFRTVLMIGALVASQFIPLFNLIVGLLMIIDYDAGNKRLDINIQYFIGLLFLVASAFAMNLGSFVRNTGNLLPALNVGALFAVPGGVAVVAPTVDANVRRDKNGRFSSARAITN